MKIIRSHWISLDICPVCKSDNTFHSEWMKNPGIQCQGTCNAYRLEMAKSRKGDPLINPNEFVFSKTDLCLQCGHTWIMYVEHSILEPIDGELYIKQ
jgi:hypothetical protein